MKLSAHMIPVHWSQDDERHLQRIRPKSLKLVDFHPSRTRQFMRLSPESLFVLRDHPLSEQKSDMWRDPTGTGIRHADEWAAKLDTWHLPAPLEQILVCGINEPNVWWDNDNPDKRNTPDAAGVRVATDYTVAFAQRLAQHGIRGLLLNLSVGWPANTGPDTPPDWSTYERIRDEMFASWQSHGIVHVLGLHEYWPWDGPQVSRGWLAERYTKCPWQVPILMGECGVSQRVVDSSVPETQSGWKGNLSEQTYWDQLMQYEGWLQADPRVHSAQVFSWDAHMPFVASDDIRDMLEWFPTNVEFDTMADWYTRNPGQPGDGDHGSNDGDDGGGEGGEPVAVELVWPLDGRISQNFNMNPSWYPSHPGHMGLDIAAPLGTPIRSMAAGIVAWSDFDPGYGNYVRVWHPQLRVHSFYAHLDSRDVERGDAVKAGDVVGLCGTTGRSTGPHLHWEVRITNESGQYVDPGNGHGRGRIDPLSAWRIWERAL